MNHGALGYYGVPKPSCSCNRLRSQQVIKKSCPQLLRHALLLRHLFFNIPHNLLRCHGNLLRQIIRVQLRSVIIRNFTHRADPVSPIGTSGRDLRTNNLLHRFLKGTTPTRRVVVVRKKWDTEDVGLSRLLEGVLGHIGEVNGGRVFDRFERASGVEFTSCLRLGRSMTKVSPHAVNRGRELPGYEVGTEASTVGRTAGSAFTR